jgi:hypothetical protein
MDPTIEAVTRILPEPDIEDVQVPERSERSF